MKKVSTFIILFSLANASPIMADAKKEPVKVEPPSLKQFLSSEKKDSFFDSLSNFSRDSGEKITDQKKLLVIDQFDFYLPKLDLACDVTVSYRFSQIGYAAARQVEGSMKSVKEYADSILSRTPQQFQAVNPQCLSEMQGFAVAINNIFGMKFQPLAQSENLLFNEDDEKPKKMDNQEKNLKSLNNLNAQDFKSNK